MNYSKLSNQDIVELMELKKSGNITQEELITLDELGCIIRRINKEAQRLARKHRTSEKENEILQAYGKAIKILEGI